MTLTYIQSESTYSLYRDRDGQDVFLALGPGIRRLVDTADIDLYELWSALAFTMSYSQSAFLTHLRTLAIYPEDLAGIDFCADCSLPGWHDEMTYTGAVEENNVCSSCADERYTCDRCGYLRLTTTETLSGRDVCDSCLADYYTYCENCEGYYGDQYAYEHEHDDPDDDEECNCCESPETDFVIRNDGSPTLANDTRVTVTLPSGVISAEGIDVIRRNLRCDGSDVMAELAYKVDDIGTQWQTREGNFTKRLSRLAYKTFGVKLSPDMISRIGNIASDHSRAVDYRIDVTRDLNQSPEQFFHSGSCWWGSHSSSRCALKSNGGYGLRTFDDSGYVSGRVWVMPLRLTDAGCLVPTFETFTSGAYVVFNGYGALSGYSAARIVAHLAGMTYRRIAFTCEPMWVNGSTGYLVAPEEVAAGYTDGSLILNVEQHSDLYYRENGSSYAA